ncbi:MAG: hypothetical protein CVU87_00300 [Firmicutes bacterium HGW-Firmicutes-12]|jgi:putative membrane fusion protein|nr:MAG: hypothetical protein CVU87_00300 [Firmicutes bacterium HGW-Firmicutes-12]
MNTADTHKKREIKRNGRRYRVKRIVRTILLLSLVVLVIYFSRGHAKTFVLQFFVKTIPVEYSVLEDTRDASFLLIRSEKTVTSPIRGRYERKYQEGDRVANNSVVGYLVKTIGTSLEQTERIPIMSPYAGMLSYYTDGYEKLCNPDVWSQLDLNKLVELQKGLVAVESGETKNNSEIEAGQRLFKIVDNLAPQYLFTEIELPDDSLIQIGNTIVIKLEAEGNLRIQGVIDEIERYDSIMRVLIEIPATPILREYRKINGSIIVDNYEGIILEQDVLVHLDNKVGVYLLDQGLVRWQEVGIVGKVGSKVAIEGLPSKNWIIATPGFVEEGQRLDTYKD